MAKLKGRDLIIFNGSNAIAYQKECSLTMNCDVEEKASASSSNWKEYFTKRNSWKMSCSALLPESEDDPASYIGVTVTIALAISNTPSSGIDAADRRKDGYLNVTGRAIITSAKIGGGMSGHVTWDMEFQGTGELV